jgi:hypothetical protein
MTPLELLVALRRRGIDLTVDGERLRVEAPRGALTPELRRTLAEHKPELIAELSQAAPGSPECLEAERHFSGPHARLFPLLGQAVATPQGPGRLVQVFRERAGVMLNTDPGQVVYLLPSEVRPPGMAADPGQSFEAVH